MYGEVVYLLEKAKRFIQSGSHAAHYLFLGLGDLKGDTNLYKQQQAFAYSVLYTETNIQLVADVLWPSSLLHTIVVSPPAYSPPPSPCNTIFRCTIVGQISQEGSNIQLIHAIVGTQAVRQREGCHEHGPQPRKATRGCA